MITTCKNKLQLKNKRERKCSLLIEGENGTIERLTLDEKLICWEGFRSVSGRLMRGVPKRNREDCIKYCCHEGCQFI